MSHVSAPMAGSFALGTFSAGDATFAGLLRDDRVLDLGTVALPITTSGPLSTRKLLENWADVLPALPSLPDNQGVWYPLADLDVRAPVQPRQIIQAGANYRTHVMDLAVKYADPADGRSEQQVRAEAGEMMDRRRLENKPYFFIGLPAAVTGPFDDVELPGYSNQHDWELELAAVIGKTAFRLDPDEALEHVAGYTIVNDLTTRDLVFRKDMPEIGTDWFRAKNAPGFLPVGPYVVPSEFVGDPSALTLTLRLNGDVMQDESAKDMIFDVAALVAGASQITPLLPGDLVLTGSPAGNGMHHGRLLRDGDVMTATITGLGEQRTRCIAERTT